IFVHELGHYLCARLAGIRVHVFSLGFGPRLWGFVRGGTDYRISALPLGGFVQEAGEDPTAAARVQARTGDLVSKSLFARAFFYSGGVIMNVLFALVVFPMVFRIGVQFDAPVIGAVAAGGPAWEAGLQHGDRIRSINGKDVYSFNNITVEVALASSLRGVKVQYQRDGADRECVAHPRYDKAMGIRTLEVRNALEPGPVRIEVPEGTPAFAAGLRTGDELVMLEGKHVPSHREFDTVLTTWEEQEPRAGKRPVKVMVRRGGDSAKPQEFSFQAEPDKRATPKLGIYLSQRTVQGFRDTPATRALQLRRGDRVLFVDGQPFRGGDLKFQESGKTVQLVVQRTDAKQPVELTAEVPSADRAALAKDIALVADPADLLLRPMPASAAAAAGVRRGDLLRAIGGKPVTKWEQVIETVEGAAGKPLVLALVRDSGPFSVTIEPRREPTLGFRIQVRDLREAYRVEGLGASIKAGLVASVDMIKQVYVTLRKLFTGEVSTSNLGGIITIARVSYMNAQEGLSRLLYFLAVLSINLAVINVLPIPVLDGGHLMFLLIERIKGSPVSARVHSYSQILGMVFVLALLLYVTYNDILKLSWFLSRG
ncbi:MAG: RIP metalloprotease RseP, partial [Planctomycetes bacterium]|nr:RIP metalloprotease RseP [Planctomycetota bacterium]